VQPKDNGPLTVRLQNWGTLTGRLVDVEGKPVAHRKIYLRYPDAPGSGMRPPDQEFATDRDGRFRVEGLLPDRDHELILERGTKPTVPVFEGKMTQDVILSDGNASKKLKTHAGEVKDLGGITLKMVPMPKKNSE
jgi:hypothetical protein